jgi:Rieske Fe-S protein
MTTLLVVLAAWVVASVPLGIACGAVLARGPRSSRGPDRRRVRPSPHHQEILLPQDNTPLPPVTDARRPVPRRAVVAGTGAVALGAGLLAAGCASSAAPGSAATTTSAAPTTASGSTASGSAGALGSTADIPVGGGKIFADRKVVVTQPTAGTFVGLSAVCTHKGCVVNKVADGTIDCPCHGSKFHLDGTVANGPAQAPLTTMPVTVEGTSINLA